MTIRTFMAAFLLSFFGVSACASNSSINSAQSDEKASASPTNCVPQAALDAYIQLRWERRVDQWNSIEAPKNAIVFLGSSIIEEGEWSALFPDFEVVNRGIGADTTQGVIDRLDQITKLQPSKVFIYIGGNDFSRLGDTPEATISRIEIIIAQLKRETPTTEIYIHTLFPRELKHAPNIKAFNQLVMNLNQDPDVRVIDVFPWFARPDGSIDPSVANDGIHLNGEAYRTWADEIRGFVSG